MYNSGYNFTTSPEVTPSDLGTAFGGLAALGVVLVIVFGLIALAVAVFIIIAKCKMYKKAGEEWWKVFIPLYSTWVETRITGLAWWWYPITIGVAALTGVRSFTYVMVWMALLISFNYNYNLAKKFGKSNGFAVLCTLLPIVGIPILGFGSAKYDKSIATDKNGIFAVEKDLVK